MLYKIQPDLYRITVDLPGNPLKSLNSYVITGEERNLIIDTGFNQPESLQALQSGMVQLKLDMNKTDVFITHFHADHSGLVSQIITPGSKVYLGAIDKKMFHLVIRSPDAYWSKIEHIYAQEGFPEGELEKARLHNPARRFVSSDDFDCIAVENGFALQVGRRNLECVFTPGHTPGHMCLYDQDNKTMFTGDHLLFDITPNITTWEVLPNALECYLESLKTTGGYDVLLALAGHRENEGNFHQRIEELLVHHKDRLDDVKQIIKEVPGVDGYHVASKMKWSIRAKNWQEFPPGQRWFAVGEAIAHLNYLVDHGEVRRTVRKGIHTYTVLPPEKEVT